MGEEQVTRKGAAAASLWRPSLHGPMGTEVYEHLLSSILGLKVAPGERITIDAVARELGVSQTPIREALHRLESEGVVVRTHLSGYRVAPPMGREEFEELVEMRLLLEPAVTRRAAERAAPETLAALHELNAQMAAPAAGGSGPGYALFARLDAELHDSIAAGGGNRVMCAALSRLHTHVRLFRLSYTVEITAQAVVEHDAVLSAIGARDGDAAAYAMREHILASTERFRRSFTDGPARTRTASREPGREG